MGEAVSDLLHTVGVPVVVMLTAVWGVVKYIVPTVVAKAIEHTQNREMKHLEASLQSHSEMLKTSVEVGHSSVEPLRGRGIEAVEKLWDDILRVENEFATLVAVESILTDDELAESFREGVSGYDRVREFLKEYSSVAQVIGKTSGRCDDGQDGTKLAALLGCSPSRLARERLFVTGELWRTYEALIGLHGRLGALACRRMETGDPVSWKNDTHSRKIVEDVVPIDVWNAAKNMQFSGFRGVTGFLRQQFIVEAKRYMGGTEQFAETFREYHRILEEEEMDARERRKQYQRYNK